MKMKMPYLSLCFKLQTHAPLLASVPELSLTTHTTRHRPSFIQDAYALQVPTPNVLKMPGTAPLNPPILSGENAMCLGPHLQDSNPPCHLPIDHGEWD